MHGPELKKETIKPGNLVKETIKTGKFIMLLLYPELKVNSELNSEDRTVICVDRPI